MRDMQSHLRRYGIRATPQRVAVARYVLQAGTHPTADEVWDKVRCALPSVSRATVYNTLNLLVEKGLLRQQILRGGIAVFDALVVPHHHFIDEPSGRIYDVPWEALEVTGHRSLDGFDVREIQVVMKGVRRNKARG